MAFAHDSILSASQLHGLEHLVIYGIVIVALTATIKLLWKVGN